MTYSDGAVPLTHTFEWVAASHRLAPGCGLTARVRRLRNGVVRELFPGIMSVLMARVLTYLTACLAGLGHSVGEAGEEAENEDGGAHIDSEFDFK